MDTIEAALLAFLTSIGAIAALTDVLPPGCEDSIGSSASSCN